MSTGNGLGADMEAAIRMNAAAVAIQCFIGGGRGGPAPWRPCAGRRTPGSGTASRSWGSPAVGKEMARTTEYFLLATRILAELGASFVKTYYCEGFEKVVAACPVPIVIAGGKKLPELEALERPGRPSIRGPGAWTWAGTSSSPTAPPAWPRPSPRWSTRAIPPGRLRGLSGS